MPHQSSITNLKKKNNITTKTIRNIARLKSIGYRED